MADLNALIAQGAQFQAPPDPFAQYGRMQQLQQGQQANALNQMKMDEYQRGLQEQNALRGLDPAAADYLAQVKKVNPKLGFEFEKAANEAANLKLTGIKTQTDIVEGKRKLLDASLRNMASNPSDENIIAHTQDYALNPLFKDELPSIQANAQRLLAMTPEQRKAVLSGAGATAGDLSTAESARLSRLTTERGQDIGATTAYRGQDIGASTATRGQNLTAGAAASRLAFDQEKSTYERANPGYELKEILQPDNTTQVVAVNKKTLQAVPVMMAGAPGAAPAGAGRGAVGVTGGQVGPGTPLVGAAKPGALTEAQGNAALFGSAMAQAQGVLDQVEKRGTKTGAVTTSLAQGIVKYVPLGVGDKLVGDVYALAMQDPTKLFGPDVDQQKLGQAQLAFSIAYLRKTSGAAFGPSELANTVNEFFPQIGEDASVTKQKSEARKRAIKGMKISAGKEGSKFIEEYEAPGTAGGEWKVVK